MPEMRFLDKLILDDFRKADSGFLNCRHVLHKLMQLVKCTVFLVTFVFREVCKLFSLLYSEVTMIINFRIYLIRLGFNIKFHFCVVNKKIFQLNMVYCSTGFNGTGLTIIIKPDNFFTGNN